MKLLADESVERAVLEDLRAEGHDVLAVSESRPGIQDSSVLNLAAREERVLVTNDQDFATLAFLKRQASAGIVLLRMARWRSARKAERLVEVVREHERKLGGCMTVVEERSIRRREFQSPG